MTPPDVFRMVLWLKHVDSVEVWSWDGRQGHWWNADGTYDSTSMFTPSEAHGYSMRRVPRPTWAYSVLAVEEGL